MNLWVTDKKGPCGRPRGLSSVCRIEKVGQGAETWEDADPWMIGEVFD